MRVRLAALLVLLFAAACQRSESTVTGNYGSGVVSGQVVMSSELGSPAGVNVSAVGTGMTTVLSEDGRFVFANVPEGVQLHFTRADGVDASLRATGGTMRVELTRSGATSGRRRGAVPTRKIEYEGVVRATTADTLTLFDSHGQETTFQVTASTSIRKGGTPLLLSDIKVNDRVHVKALPDDTTHTALEIIVQNPDDGDDGNGEDHGGQTATANGTVKVAGTSEIVVTTVPKGDVTVKIDASTIIRKRGSRITAADIKAGDEVNSMGKKLDDHSIQAVQIEVRGTSGK